MDIMIILGLIATCGAFYFGVPDLRAELMTYMQMDSFVLVFGGTLASTMLSTSLKEFKSIIVVFKQLIFNKKKLKSDQVIEILINVSKVAQTSNKQALINEGKGVGDGFLERALTMIGDGLDKDFIKRTLETDIMEVQRRHTSMINVIRTMGSYAPMFGMTGTVLGVVQVLKNVTDIDNIVAGMSLALLTTLYGLILTSIFFIPLSNKLKGKSAEETLVKEIILEGVLMIIDKEIPLKVEKYLTSYLSNKLRNNEK